jgi:hypothetical protein
MRKALFSFAHHDSSFRASFGGKFYGSQKENRSHREGDPQGPIEGKKQSERPGAQGIRAQDIGP